MKKYLIILLVLTIAFSLFGCSNNNQNEFAIKIVVPAGSQEEFVFSHEEISPKSDSITIMADGDFPDTEIILQTVDAKAEYTFEPSYITHGMPVKMAVEKDAWFKVGLNIQNDTDEEQIYTLIIKPIEVRIEDNDSAEKVSGYISELGKGVLSQAVPMSEEDTNTIAEILNEPGWINDKPKCLFDCELIINGATVYYHSDCGMFETTDTSLLEEQNMIKIEKDGTENLPDELKLAVFCLDITDETRDMVNEILGKYANIEGVERKVGYEYEN